MEILTPLAGEDFCRVAVLPFTNLSDYRDGNLLFNRVFGAELCRKMGFRLASEGDIMAVYRQVGLNPYLDHPGFDNLRIIGDYLGADMFVIGHIVEMGEKTAGNKIVPYLTVYLELVEASSGRTIVQVNHKRSGDDYLKVMHFGIITTMTELCRKVTEEIINDLTAKGLKEKCLK